MKRFLVVIVGLFAMPLGAFAADEPVRLLVFHQNRVQMIAIERPNHATHERTAMEQGFTQETYTPAEARQALRQHPLKNQIGLPATDTLPNSAKITKAELVTWWQRQSTGRAFRVDVAPAVSPYTEAVTAKIAALLDQNHDGQISKAEADVAEKSLLAVDADDDECVIALELVPDLLTVPAPKALPQPAVVVIQPGFTPDDIEAEIHAFRPNASTSDIQQWLKLPAKTIHLKPTERQRLVTAIHDVVQYPLNGLSTTCSIIHQQRSWFELLDQNQDGQLSRRELRRTWEALRGLTPDNAEMIPVRRPETVPLSLTFTSGSKAKRGIPLQRTLTPSDAPKWFTALDRNGDHDLSRREFNGGDALFQQLDRDGDGLISISEAKGYRQP